ncbi:Histone acetyltransferase KAT6A [Amphibalanus amphitrite]|uniref:Histone acetyltransferase KAT6A n=1 Tax=Amphibalanus amphitrite TaxID=1232801 RepID=A0A6A4W002_AMPAM|nr:Histone acetyltransferase KAT6A [Amphibalanus amphitrite]
MASLKPQTFSKSKQCIKDWILTAIDQLKLRKARPDRYRIAYVLNKQFGVDIDAVNEVLEQMTDEHSIVRVDYKGSVSYRDIKNWLRISKDIEVISIYAGALVLNSDRASAALQEAVKTLSKVSKSPTVTLAEIEHYFKDKNHNQFTTAPLAVALQREVNAGHLLKSGMNTFSVKSNKKLKQTEMHRMDSPTSDVTSDGNDTTNENGKRVKKTKVIFDPSEVRRPVGGPPAPKRLKTAITPMKVVVSTGRGTTTRASASSTPATPAAGGRQSAAGAAGAGSAASAGPGKPTCHFCKRPGRQEVVLVCRQCKTPAHPSCLGYSKRLTKKIQDKPWTCMDCKTCVLCRDVGGELIFCDHCDLAFHMLCHQPKVRRKPSGEWMCSGCRRGAGAPSRMGRPPKLAWKPEPQSPPKPVDSKPQSAPEAKPVDVDVKPLRTAKPAASSTRAATTATTAGAAAAARLGWPAQLMAAPVDPTVPDISDWSVAKVVAYFKRHGFEKHAPAFEEHEVDGPALLMLSRLDVLRGLGIKLGPALKIYNHVKLLQTRRRACLDFCLL